MPHRNSRRFQIAVWFCIFALAGAVLIAGCGGKKSESDSAQTPGGAAAGPAGAGGAAAGGAAAGGAAAGGGMRGGGMRGGGGGGGGMRGGGGRRGGGGGGGGMRGGGGRRGGGMMEDLSAAPGGEAAGAAEVAAPTIKPREMSDVDKAKKLQEFTKLYGPTTVVKDKNWDGTPLEYVKFTHSGKQVKMPVSMIYDADDPKALEGYFEIYVW